ncbi:MAG TPA: alpha/beta family hydrolase [Jatrophihabitantaceae bacterium]|nr:alpha/beta family hydrolase [Jatrophihabitantaceae bacterium]
MSGQYVDTPVGPAEIAWFESATPARAVLVLGHGSATGVDAPDLQAIAAALPPRGITVALVTQPYRLARALGAQGPTASDEPSLDAAWRAVWPHLTTAGLPMIAGGRSAGSQVACRTANALGARGVIALSYPLLGPGSPHELLATGLPTLIVQGGNDPYGTPRDFPPLPPTFTLVDVPLANHTFNVPARTGGAIARVTEAVTTWVDDLIARSHTPDRG